MVEKGKLCGTLRAQLIEIYIICVYNSEFLEERCQHHDFEIQLCILAFKLIWRVNISPVKLQDVQITKS